ncbi:cytochrome c oxidase subunit II [Halocalculus aciditolerans]|uniref:Cytochrome c oxidase subunit II n=1 Tax=Halocalculus aciditolerans TaxID=1383812 RepID=A0A830FEB2_9EURY|nr:cytochrome c oxidase subunit II [Halocalculus aciditolerans]GGL66902.1 cytochrome c oxidase subunit II [Halocalculus aciditolerans]
MDIHRYEKIWIAISLLFIVGLIASVVYGVIGLGVTTTGNSHETINSNDLSNTEFADPGGRWVESDHYVVDVVTRQFLFQPGTQTPIMVPANTTVTFRVASPDVVHGFEVVGTNINVIVVPGQVNRFSTTFDQPNTYGIVCNEYCGAGHQNMQGQLVVVPRSALPPTENTTANQTSNSTQSDRSSRTPLNTVVGGDR